jgi:hypothetical protein
MIYSIRKLAGIIAIFSFVIIFLSGIDTANPFNMNIALIALLKALLGSILFWFAGIVICDIIIKGIVEDIPIENLDEIEGGMVQRIYTTKQEPFIEDKSVYPEKKPKPKKDKKEIKP